MVGFAYTVPRMSGPAYNKKLLRAGVHARIVFHAVGLCAVCALGAICVSGCASTPVVGGAARTYAAPASRESVIRAVHRALDRMQYATARTAYDRWGNYVVTAYDRPGNQVTVQVSQSDGQATRVDVGIEPGQNDEMRQQIIRVIDSELRH